MQLVAVDIGGTHARFAIAEVSEAGVITLAEPVTLKTSDYVSLQTAWEAFEKRAGGPVPRAAAIAIAGPVTGQTVRMTNNSWVLNTGALDAQLGLDKVTVLNDFAAVAHAVAQAPADQFVHITGPDRPLPNTRHNQRGWPRHRPWRGAFSSPCGRLPRAGDRRRAYRFCPSRCRG